MAPQRVADAANVSPYPFVARPERKGNPAPDNAGRTGQGRKTKTKPRAERNPRQEEEIRFNIGPRNLRNPPSAHTGRRGLRFPGRAHGDDRNGVPDYPPPSFQEAINTPALSVCSSTTSLVPGPSVPLIIPEHIPEHPPMTSSERALVDPLNETTASDNASDSDESMFIINANEIPVGSADLPRGPDLEERVRKDWLRRRGVEFPSNSSQESPRSSEESQPRGRSAVRPPALNIDPDVANNDIDQGPSPTSSKRRFLSLSPLRTIFPTKSVVHQDRAMSAHPSPSSNSSPYSGSRNFFRSTTSLATVSFLRLPLTSVGGKSDSISRKIFSHKGKERAKTPEVHDDAWEVVDESAYAGVDKEGVERRVEHPRSLMSAIESMSMNTSTTSLGSSPTRSLSFTFGSQVSSDHLRSKRAHMPSLNVVYNSESVGSSSTIHLSSFREKSHTTAFVDRTLNRRSAVPSPSILEVSESITSPTAEATTPMTHVPIPAPYVYASPPQGVPLTTARVRQTAPSPPPSAVRHVAHSPSPLRVDASIDISYASVTPAMHQRALETPLPDTPLYQNHFEYTTPSNQPTIAPIMARYTPDLATNSISASDTPASCICNVHPTASRVPSPPPSVPIYSRSTTGTPILDPLEQTSSSGESMTPARHHYTGRPLPRPPPTINRDRSGIIDSTYASPPESSSDHSFSRPCREGLLIDLEDTSLDDSISGTSTPRSDEDRFRSQTHLPFMPPSASSLIELEEYGPEPDISSLSFASMQATSTPVVSMQPTQGQGHLPYPSQQSYEPYLLQHPQPRQGPRYSELTDLDLLVSRLGEVENDGSDYETLLLVSEVIGPATPSSIQGLRLDHLQPETASTSSTSQSTFSASGNMSLIGRIEVERRRTMKDGRVKVKLTLLDIAVNKCGICLSQFKEGELAGLTSVCQHTFHESCLARWLARSKTCPLCRVSLDADVR